MKRKSLTEFIRENRAGIDEVINGVTYRHDGNGGRGKVPVPAPRYNDVERRQWLLNDEGLYLWARSEGVRI